MVRGSMRTHPKEGNAYNIVSAGKGCPRSLAYAQSAKTTGPCRTKKKGGD